MAAVCCLHLIGLSLGALSALAEIAGSAEQDAQNCSTASWLPTRELSLLSVCKLGVQN